MIRHHDNAEVLLIQPTMGITGEFALHPPLSLLYVAAGLKKNGFQPIIIDHRVHYDRWQISLLEQLARKPVYVGITVMSGAPIRHSIEVSQFVKQHSRIPVVWGGSLATLAPQDILREPFVDFTVSGSGFSSAWKLAQALQSLASGNDSDTIFDDIPGLGFKRGKDFFFRPRFHGFEHVPYQDIPYDLISDYSVYTQIGSRERIFPIYGAYGCPYQCAFCISPSMYRDYHQKWMPLSPIEIADHIEFLMSRFGATEIYFYDDDSFVNPDHVRAFMTEIKRRGLKPRLSFRGARINEILTMNDAFLDDLADGGTHILHIGIESGSPRILKLFRKGVTVDDILEANRRLARNSRIIAAYNWILGTPSETPDDIAQTIKLITTLLKENPRAFIFQPNKFHPIPGTELASLAERFGYRRPATLQAWIDEECEGEKIEPWYSKKTNSIIRMLQVTSYFIDRKPELLLEAKSAKNSLIKFLMRLYRPIARFRFRYRITAALWEYGVFQAARNRLI
ncbi:MAG: B12-binding domain-containing radical SAM protein [Candidatus Riflebacteria bacterium]|nr:B12-binding domain-containing radical SAM protein [Candidatus Riflebacteria bacterium]